MKFMVLSAVTLVKQYKNWFTFEVKDKAEGAADYYEIEDVNGKVKITGNSGVTIANGLNYYLKYYCKVSSPRSVIR